MLLFINDNVVLNTLPRQQIILRLYKQPSTTQHDEINKPVFVAPFAVCEKEEGSPLLLHGA